MGNKLSTIIDQQLPQFVREYHPTYVKFLEAYFSQLEEQGNTNYFLHNYERNLDADLMDDNFVEKFIQELAATFPKEHLIDDRDLIKNIKEFYLAKGAESSFKFIFTLLFNEDIEMIYPRIYLHESSKGSWGGRNICYLTANNIDKVVFDNDTMSSSLFGITSNNNAIIDTIDIVTHLGEKFLKIELSSYEKEFTIGESVKLSINDYTMYETVLKSINEIQINDSGKDYSVGDLVTISGDGVNARAVIVSTTTGAYTEYTINSAGTGYVVGDIITAVPTPGSMGHSFSAEVAEIGGLGEIVSLRIFSGGFLYEKSTTAEIESSGGSDADISLTGNIGQINSLKILDSGWNYSTATVSITSETGTGFDGTAIFSTIYNEPKKYSNDDDWPSGSSKLLDSYFYQQFSYAVKSSISPDRWKDVIRENVHPAGTQQFAIYSIEALEDVSVEIAEPESTLIDLNNIVTLEDDSISIGIGVDQITSPESHENELMIILDMETAVLCSAGITYYDIEITKFNSNFDWTLYDFQDTTFEDFVQENCRYFVAVPYAEPTEITII